MNHVAYTTGVNGAGDDGKRKPRKTTRGREKAARRTLNREEEERGKHKRKTSTDVQQRRYAEKKKRTAQCYEKKKASDVSGYTTFHRDGSRGHLLPHCTALFSSNGNMTSSSWQYSQMNPFAKHN